MTPLISIVISSYNQSHYLKEAIATIVAQTQTNFELLVWDDGSTDNSVEVAQNYAATDPRIRVIAAEHQGRGNALKAAIAHTSSPYLGWVDRDDLLAPTALEQTAAVLDAHPEVGLVYTDYADIDKDGKFLGLGKRCQIPYSPDRLLTDFMMFHFRLLRRSVYDRIGGIDPAFEYIEDYELCLRLSEVTPVHHIHQPLYFYRIHPENTSRYQRQTQIFRSKTAISQALDRRGLSDKLKIHVEGGKFSLRPVSRQKSIPLRVASFLVPVTLPLGAIAALSQPLQPFNPFGIANASEAQTDRYCVGENHLNFWVPNLLFHPLETNTSKTPNRQDLTQGLASLPHPLARNGELQLDDTEMIIGQGYGDEEGEGYGTGYGYS